MKKKIISIILIAGVVASLVGCGSSNKKNVAVSTEAESVEAETIENESVAESEKVMDTESTEKKEEETSYSAEDYEEQKDIFVVKQIDIGDGSEIDFTNEEFIDGPFVLTESIDIYSFFFTYAGYTKPDIKIRSVGKVDDWIVVPFAQSSFLVKAEDFDRAAVLKKKEESGVTEGDDDAGRESAAIDQKALSAQQEDGANTEKEAAPVSEAESQPEAPAPAVTTYSEAEVISIFRSTLESNGIQWYPDSAEYAQWPEAGPSGGMGWGIENISMTDPYGDAEKAVEGFQFGGWQYYYLESQGSSNGYVHLKLYSG